MKRDYVVTFVTEICVLISVFIAFRIAAKYWGTLGFGEYSMAKRLFGLLQPIVLLGLGVGIPRYIALKSEELSTRSSDAYFFSGLIMLIVVAVVCYCAINMFPGVFAYLFFGKGTYVVFMPPLGLLIVGISLHSAAYTYYRGHLHMIYANILRFVNASAIILLIFLIPRLSVHQYFFYVGLAWCIVSFVAILTIVRTMNFRMLQWQHMTSHATELLKYGIVRIPADLGIAGLLTVPAIFTAHAFGIEKAGFVAFGTSILNMVSGAFLPIGLVLLPVASRMVAKKDFGTLEHTVMRILRYSCGVALCGVILVLLLADKIISVYLGPGFTEVASVVRVICVGILPFVVYVVLRNALDAIKVKPLNTKNIMICLVVCLIAAFVLAVLRKPYIYLLWVLTGCCVMLGVLSFLDFRRNIEGLKRDTN